MLHRVQRGALLVQPARKGPPPFFVDAADDHLDKGPRQLFGLPRRGLFAGPQAEDDVADHRDALCHRRPAIGERRAARVNRLDRPVTSLIAARQILLDHDGRIGLAVRPGAIAEPATERENHNQDRRSDPALHHSGTHAS
jgi:hypothetical protein